MQDFTSTSTVLVRPFQHRSDGDLATLQFPEEEVYLSVPAEAVDILQWLTQGLTIQETVDKYCDKYDETPDIVDFLDTLAEDGLVGTTKLDDPDAQLRRTGVKAHSHSHQRWHLEGVSQKAAIRLFGLPTMLSYGAIIMAGLAIVAYRPSLVPSSAAFLFPENFAVLTWITLAVALIGAMIHEAAHVVAAKAAGAPARIQMGQRMYVPVIETDMSAVWMAAPWRRHIAYLSGPVVDAAFAAILLGVLLADSESWIALSSDMGLLVPAITFTYLARISWQCLFFFRTDFYYVLATGLNCASLMDDTEVLLQNVLARLRRRPEVADQSAIPHGERRKARVFAVVWIIGRAVALVVFAVVAIPVLWGYGVEAFRFLTGRPTSFDTFDFLTAAIVTSVVNGIGISLWVRALYRSRQRRKALAEFRESRERHRTSDIPELSR